MEDREVLAAIQQIASDQGKIVASLTGHVDLDNERFRGMNEKLDRIDRRTESTARDVASLKETRTYNRGRAWMIAKIFGLAGVIVAIAELAITWAKGSK